jgi:hypothetical protein
LDLAILANTAHAVSVRAVKAVLGPARRKAGLARSAAAPSMVETPGAKL